MCLGSPNSPQNKTCIPNHNRKKKWRLPRFQCFQLFMDITQFIFAVAVQLRTCRWWNGLELQSRLSFARDRVVECYFWIVGVYFEPSYSRARIILTKVIAIVSLLDDTYDVYGTPQECELFTECIERFVFSMTD
jgi:hypothetical protein